MPVTYSDLSDLSRSHKSAAEAVAYAIASLESALSVSRYHISGASRDYLEMRRDMPYLIHETTIPETYILVNRNYKPLGSNQPAGGDWAKYEDFTNLHIRLTPAQIASVVSPGYSHGLFGDGNPPWSGRKAAQAYLVRLQRLHRHLRAR
jgi:hypothetical protein